MSEAKIPQEVLDIAAGAKLAMTVDGASVELGKGFYENSLPADITMDHVRTLQKHNANFISGVGLAFGEVSTKAMKKDKQLQETQLSSHIGKDQIGGVFRREYEKSLGIPKDGGERQTKTAYGSLSMSYRTFGSAGSRGSLKKVRDSLNDMAEEMLGK